MDEVAIWLLGVLGLSAVLQIDAYSLQEPFWGKSSGLRLWPQQLHRFDPT